MYWLIEMQNIALTKPVAIHNYSEHRFLPRQRAKRSYYVLSCQPHRLLGSSLAHFAKPLHRLARSCLWRCARFARRVVPPPPPPVHSAVCAAAGCLIADAPLPAAMALTPDTLAEKFESFQRINSIRETNGNFDSCNSCKRLVPSRLHELHESKFPFVSRIKFIRLKLSNFSAHVSGASVALISPVAAPSGIERGGEPATRDPVRPASYPDIAAGFDTVLPDRAAAAASQTFREQLAPGLRTGVQSGRQGAFNSRRWAQVWGAWRGKSRWFNCQVP